MADKQAPLTAVFEEILLRTLMPALVISRASKAGEGVVRGMTLPLPQILFIEAMLSLTAAYEVRATVAQTGLERLNSTSSPPVVGSKSKPSTSPLILSQLRILPAPCSGALLALLAKKIPKKQAARNGRKIFLGAVAGKVLVKVNAAWSVHKKSATNHPDRRQLRR